MEDIQGHIQRLKKRGRPRTVWNNTVIWRYFEFLYGIKNRLLDPQKGNNIPLDEMYCAKEYRYISNVIRKTPLEKVCYPNEYL